MDTSKKYIDMCKAAHEIQDMWEPSEGDWFYYEAGKTKGIGVIGDFADVEKSIMRTWGADDSGYEDVDVLAGLPTIDQLIEMSNIPWREFLFNVVEHNIGVGESPEIIAMYVLMRTLYDKTWNGENWTNIV